MNVVLLHLLCVELVARGMPEAAKRLGAALGWLCGVPVALYAVHPLRVELVAWASMPCLSVQHNFLAARDPGLSASPPCERGIPPSLDDRLVGPDRAGRALERVGGRAAVRLPDPRCLSVEGDLAPRRPSWSAVREGPDRKRPPSWPSASPSRPWRSRPSRSGSSPR